MPRGIGAFFDPNGIRLELATSIAGAGLSVIESGRQTEAEARAELETLFEDPADVGKWLARMPLVESEIEVERPVPVA